MTRLDNAGDMWNNAANFRPGKPLGLAVAHWDPGGRRDSWSALLEGRWKPPRLGRRGHGEPGKASRGHESLVAPGQIDSGWTLDGQAFPSHVYDGSMSMSARSAPWQATL